MGYKSFEELEVYKAAREFRKKIYKLMTLIHAFSKKDNQQAKPVRIVTLSTNQLNKRINTINQIYLFNSPKVKRWKKNQELFKSIISLNWH